MNKESQWYNPMQWIRDNRVKNNSHLLPPNHQLVSKFYKPLEKEIKKLEKIKSDANRLYYNISDYSYQQIQELFQKIEEKIEPLRIILFGMQKVASSEKIIKTAQDFDYREKQKQYNKQIKERQKIQNLEARFQSSFNNISSIINNIIQFSKSYPDQLGEFSSEVSNVAEQLGILSTITAPTTTPAAPAVTPATPTTPTATTTTPSASTPATPTRTTPATPANVANYSVGEKITSDDVYNLSKTYGFDVNKFYSLLNELFSKKIITAKDNKKIVVAQTSGPLDSYKPLSKVFTNNDIAKLAERYGFEPNKVYLALRTLMNNKKIDFIDVFATPEIPAEIPAEIQEVAKHFPDIEPSLFYRLYSISKNSGMSLYNMVYLWKNFKQHKELSGTLDAISENIDNVPKTL